MKNNLPQEEVLEVQSSGILLKTYTLLTVGFIFMAIGAMVGLNFISTMISLGKWGFLIVSLLATIGTMFLAIMNQRNIFGYLFFVLFTFVIGFFDAPAIAWIFNSSTLFEIFKLAFVLTAIITGGLTTYVLVTKKDFSFLGGFLFTGLIIVVSMVVLSLFWKNDTLEFVLSGMGALLFSAFILYDTSRLVHEKGTPVEIAVALFLDIVNLFWMLFDLLRIISGED